MVVLKSGDEPTKNTYSTLSSKSDCGFKAGGLYVPPGHSHQSWNTQTEHMISWVC